MRLSSGHLREKLTPGSSDHVGQPWPQIVSFGHLSPVSPYMTAQSAGGGCPKSLFGSPDLPLVPWEDRQPQQSPWVFFETQGQSRDQGQGHSWLTDTRGRDKPGRSDPFCQFGSPWLPYSSYLDDTGHQKPCGGHLQRVSCRGWIKNCNNCDCNFCNCKNCNIY